ncbi:hypothetical protein A2U01_0006004, partial [Trifolium medium]|nr:hypothetical protein [Trifolium medium]
VQAHTSRRCSSLSSLPVRRDSRLARDPSPCPQKCWCYRHEEMLVKICIYSCELLEAITMSSSGDAWSVRWDLKGQTFHLLLPHVWATKRCLYGLGERLMVFDQDRWIEINGGDAMRRVLSISLLCVVAATSQVPLETKFLFLPKAFHLLDLSCFMIFIRQKSTGLGFTPMEDDELLGKLKNNDEHMNFWKLCVGENINVSLLVISTSLSGRASLLLPVLT